MSSDSFALHSRYFRGYYGCVGTCNSECASNAPKFSIAHTSFSVSASELPTDSVFATASLWATAESMRGTFSGEKRREKPS